MLAWSARVARTYRDHLHRYQAGEGRRRAERVRATRAALRLQQDALLWRALRVDRAGDKEHAHLVAFVAPGGIGQRLVRRVGRAERRVERIEHAVRVAQRGRRHGG